MNNKDIETQRNVACKSIAITKTLQPNPLRFFFIKKLWTYKEKTVSDQWFGVSYAVPFLSASFWHGK